MGFFSKKEGGLLDTIRCDLAEYIVWKWRPSTESGQLTRKENAIRWGSSLRVKDGEVAVFVYKQEGAIFQDFIEGPFDQILKTANLPVISKIIGLAYNGDSPFQAEVYFINLAGNIQAEFGIPYFDVYDPRFLDFAAPMAARGSYIFNITDYRGFIKLNRLIDFNIEDFKKQIRDGLAKYIKSYITNLPAQKNIPVLRIEQQILQINEDVEPHVRLMFGDHFGVNLKRFDLSAITPNKDSDGYKELRRVTADQQSKTIEAQTDINILNLADTQRINSINMEESLRIQREEAQRKQKLQTESQHLTTHQINQQAAVLTAAADSLGTMGNLGGGGGGGMNPAGMMVGMMMGGAMGGQMANMLTQVGSHVQPPPIPPLASNIQFSISINGAVQGPFDLSQLQTYVTNGIFHKGIYVWKPGLTNWVIADQVPELAVLFSPPPPPPQQPPPPPIS